MLIRSGTLQGYKNRDAIKDAPEYTEERLIRRDYELKLHDHYGHQGYWVAESAAKTSVL